MRNLVGWVVSGFGGNIPEKEHFHFQCACMYTATRVCTHKHSNQTPALLFSLSEKIKGIEMRHCDVFLPLPQSCPQAASVTLVYPLVPAPHYRTLPQYELTQCLPHVGG